MAKTLEVPGSAPDVEPPAVIIPTQAELEMLAQLRAGPKPPAAIIIPTADLPDSSTVNPNSLKLNERVLTKQGWVVSTATQAHANG